jgi:hypothetical protein
MANCEALKSNYVSANSKKHTASSRSSVLAMEKRSRDKTCGVKAMLVDHLEALEASTGLCGSTDSMSTK